MKNLLKAVFAISTFLLYSCNENENITPTKPLPTVPQTPALANFQNANELVKENDTNQKTIIIALSKPTPESGNLTLTLNSINSVHGINFETTPAAINN